MQRPRLFQLLDRALHKPVVWVAAPAGSGKTTLVASYLDSRRLPCIWHQCDEGDGDLATFFYFMGMAARKAAPRRRSPLPLLTPEYLTGVPEFTARFFGQLFRRCNTVVLDNYQDVPDDSPFHDMIAGALRAIPDGGRMLIISRGHPPPPLARHQAHGMISLLRDNDLCFTLKETRDLARERTPRPDGNMVRAMHDATAGWVAGMILMMERHLSSSDTDVAGSARDGLFDYFAGEVFDRTGEETRHFLLQTAFLPTLSAPLAGRLTGMEGAGQILSTLHRRHFFTEKCAGNGSDYRYHPLFREFLLSKARTLFPPPRIDDILRRAAFLMEETGEWEDAARLYFQAGEWQGVARLVFRHARELLAQGRGRTVAEWLAAFPVDCLEADPWLVYWSGVCAFPADMACARGRLEQAFVSFRAAEDVAGLYLAWAGIVDTHAFGLDRWYHLDGCIDRFLELQETFPPPPSVEIDLIASSRMLIALTLRRTDRPIWVHSWLQRVRGLLRETPSPEIQMDTIFCMSIYYLWKGEYHLNALLLERASAELRRRQPSPFANIRVKLMRGIHHWVTADYGTALATLAEGREISRTSGVRVFDSLLWGFGAAAEMAPGNPEPARDALNRQMGALLDEGRTLDIFFYHVNAAWHGLLSGEPSRAAEHLEQVSSRVTDMGTPYYRALWHIGMAQVEQARGRGGEAGVHVRAAHRISLSMKSRVMEWYALLLDACLMLEEGNEAEGLSSLRRALKLGRENGYAHLEFHQPRLMAPLYARALAEGIEPEYVKGLIRSLNLAPPLGKPESSTQEANLESWPFPLQITTLGRFQILRDDTPLIFSGKEQKKPLELLKALIAFGGRDVPRERLTDALWPEVDGDQAAKSFETTLGRLRRLLGRDNLLLYQARQLSINPLYCRVDSLVLGELLERIMVLPEDERTALRQKALVLYPGPFLPADGALPWSAVRRETLRNGLLRVALHLGRHHESSGAWERAADSYRRGIDIDPLAEEFHRRLMICQRHLGNHSDAATSYLRCRDLLRRELGISPSSETTAVYNDIIRHP